MSIVEMRKLELIALKRDMNSLLERLGHAGCFQIAARERDDAREQPRETSPGGKAPAAEDGRRVA